MKICEKLTFVCDKNELSGVKKISKRVGQDVQLVFGFEPDFKEEEVSGPSVVFGTLGESKLIENLTSQKFKIEK